MKRTLTVLCFVFTVCFSSTLNAGVIFNATGNGLGGGSRWDAASRTVAGAGERSLVGGLRYSVQGGSMQAFRDLFTWDVLPSVANFTTAVQQAFDAWAAVDPVSGLGSDLTFVADLGTAVVGSNSGNGGLDIRGAEIDLFGSNDAFFWNVGDNGRQAETSFSAIASAVQLTSGTANYAGSSAIVGADIIINSNPGAIYTLDLFRRLLAHEIGHAIGLGDVENSISPGRFIDDNYDGSSNATALATLNNSWAGLVNTANPAASPLSVNTVPNAHTSLAGVDILMESFGLGIAAGNPVTNLTPLSNDDYGTRQFLYPFIEQNNNVVPEPSTFLIMALGLAGVGAYHIRQRKNTAAISSSILG